VVKWFKGGIIKQKKKKKKKKKNDKVVKWFRGDIIKTGCLLNIQIISLIYLSVNNAIKSIHKNLFHHLSKQTGEGNGDQPNSQ